MRQPILARAVNMQHLMPTWCFKLICVCWLNFNKILCLFVWLQFRRVLTKCFTAFCCFLFGH